MTIAQVAETLSQGQYFRVIVKAANWAVLPIVTILTDSKVLWSYATYREAAGVWFVLKKEVNSDALPLLRSLSKYAIGFELEQV
jgi:hypothetical protein